MTNPLRTRTAIATLAGLAALGTLAGCASTSAAADTQSGGTTSGSSSSDSSTTSGASTTSDSSATYSNGTYSERGRYTSPGGAELINVKLTLKKNVVTAVTVTTIKADPTAHEYEELFENGIAKVVVGKNIDSLNISRVAGSSLTSQGFNNALAAIKADAKK